jgi:hypothetical protein
MTDRKKVTLKKTGGDAQQTGSKESFKEKRDKAFQLMLDALEAGNDKEYKKQYKIYRSLSAGASAASDNTSDETLNMEMSKNRERFKNKRKFSGGGLVRTGHTDHRKKGMFK